MKLQLPMAFIKAVLAAWKDDTRYYINEIRITEKHLIWSDSQTLLQIKHWLPVSEAFSISIPKLIKAHEYLIANAEKFITLEIESDLITESGNYPPINTCFPVQPQLVGTINIQILEKLLKQLKALDTDKTKVFEIWQENKDRPLLLKKGDIEALIVQTKVY